MKPQLQRRVQRYGWDKAASHYEAYWRRQLEPAQKRLLEVANLKPGERVLDMACGTGLVTFPAAEAVAPGGEVLGTDISAEMVGSARQVAEQRGVGNASFERMDAEDLDLAEGSFDVALCSLGLMYVPDSLQALWEMRRSLASGGRAVALVWGERDRCGMAEIFPIADRRVSSEVCPLFFQLGAKDTLAQAFLAAGFAGVTFERFPTVLSYGSGEEACRAAFEGGPVALAYHRFDEGSRRGVRKEYLDSIEAYRNGEGYEVPGEFVIAGGYKPVGE